MCSRVLCDGGVSVYKWSSQQLVLLCLAGGAAQRRGAHAGAGGEVSAQRRLARGRESQPLHHIVTLVSHN